MSGYENFLAAPSESLLVALTKEQLIQVADHYSIELTIPKRANKEQLVDFICQRLKEEQVLPGGAPVELILPTPAKMSQLTFDEQKQLLQMQLDQRKLEMAQELEQKRIEVFEREKDRLLEMERLRHAGHQQEQARELERTRFKLEAEGRGGGGAAQHADLGSMIRFLPKFNERDPDVFFSLFENVAADQNWSSGNKTLLLQTVLIGRAQEAFVALSFEERRCYEKVKEAVLKCYELVPEAYRQRFRNVRKFERQTHLELARELTSVFNRWLTAEGVVEFGGLCNLVLLEQFKNIVPERIATYLNEHKVETVAEAAALADGYVLTHKNQVAYARDYSQRYGNRGDDRDHRRDPRDVGAQVVRGNVGPPGRVDSMPHSRIDNKMEADNKCNYCGQLGHWKRDCPSLLAHRKSRPTAFTNEVKDVGCATSMHDGHLGIERKANVFQLKAEKTEHSKVQEVKIDDGPKERTMSNYAPFITEGFVSMVGDVRTVPVKIPRDTGASESFICQSSLPLSSLSDTGRCVLIRGIGLHPFPVPLHRINLQSGFVNGEVVIAVRPTLPVDGIDLIIGNDLGGGCVWPEESCPPPVVKSVVSASAEPDKCLLDFPEVFTACAVTRAMARAQTEKPSDVLRTGAAKVFVPELPVPLSSSETIKAQKNDQSLEKYFALAYGSDKANHGYSIQNGLLVRRWSPHIDTGGADQVLQVVMPVEYRDLVLKTAHGDASGHFGVRKTYNRVLQHFYWPRIKRDITRYVKACHACQLAGKPNASIKPAPLQPIQSVGTPFEHLVIDCVGPLPPSKSGNVYLFTVMCQATRYPAAYALRTITTRSVVKALSQFISIFGLPKVIQSDRGSNFTSKTFSAALKQLRIKHNLSSAYHAQSQGVLERFHGTLKALLRAYCVELKRDWEDGLPWLLLAARAVVQDSTGFSPNELVFGHKVRTSLSVLGSDLDGGEEPPGNLADYVYGFRRRLFLAGKLATEHLCEAQTKMKRLYDRKAVARVFGPGDQVIALLPILGSPFGAKYSGPYTVLRKISESNYVVSTPERRKKEQHCHVNLLKPYYSSPLQVVGEATAASPVALALGEGMPDTSQGAAEDGVHGPDDAVLQARLNNTEALAELDSLLGHLDEGQRDELKALISEFSSLFSDTPTCTGLIEHDIDVGDSKPIRQRFYRVSPDKRKSLDEGVRYLLENGLAKPSYSSWASPCLLVKKSDNTFRFCTDYRKVNAVTKADSFPLPRIEDCVDQVGSARYVSKFDLLKGYYQVALTPRAQEISAFITPSGLYQYTRMSFGLRNAPSSFQRLMNHVVAGLEGCAVYLDDVVVYAGTWAIHLARICSLFERLAAATLTVNLAKCEFAQATVVYLGKVVGQGQVRTVRAKVLAIDKFPPPTTKKEVMRFLGMIGYYRSFCCNFSTVVAPLTNLLKSSVKFVWAADCQQAFENAKLLLSSAPVLAAPKLDQPFQMQVDASLVGAGAVLIQKDAQDIGRPVCYFSRKFNRHQLNYSTIEKEALALIWGLQHFEVYVGGGMHPVVVYTDHNPLTFLSSLQNANQRLMRWALFLQPYRLSIRHIRGTENVLADALSRAPDESM